VRSSGRGARLEIARALDPHVTPEDILNPQDFPAIAGDSRWNYETASSPAGWPRRWRFVPTSAPWR
jgi:hypothetical protein